jgi:hypothetical protein
MVLAFVKSKTDVDSIGRTGLKACEPAGALWFGYPKKTGAIETDLSRDSGWDLLSANRYRPVSQIAIDENWTGFQFRPIELVKSKSNGGRHEGERGTGRSMAHKNRFRRKAIPEPVFRYCSKSAARAPVGEADGGSQSPRPERGCRADYAVVVVTKSLADVFG